VQQFRASSAQSPKTAGELERVIMPAGADQRLLGLPDAGAHKCSRSSRVRSRIRVLRPPSPSLRSGPCRHQTTQLSTWNWKGFLHGVSVRALRTLDRNYALSHVLYLSLIHI